MLPILNIKVLLLKKIYFVLYNVLIEFIYFLLLFFIKAPVCQKRNKH